MAQSHVFLSHSTKDIAFTLQLEADLRGAGATVYRVSADQGGEFQRRIDEALVACQWVVLVLTADALASTWVQQEIYAAIRLRHDGRIKEILPIQAGAVDYRAIPPLWGVYNIFDATRDYRSARDGLMRTMGLASHGPAVAPSPSPTVATSPQRGARPAVSPPIAGEGLGVGSLPPDFPVGYEARTNGSLEFILPPVVTVPAGEFLMGSDPRRDPRAKESWAKDEQPQHRVTLPAFQIAKFPLTVAEYACFVRSGQKQPNNWQQQLGKLNHPVVNVSWHDAVAYAAWLAKQTGQPWRLPSEAEWEKAARGTDGRIYPWGDRFDASCANTYEGGKGTTTPVGSYPSGASPYGAQDMSGNVWEWTASLFKPYPYTVNDGRESQNSTDSRVLRGGSWYNSSGGSRAAFRVRNLPESVNDNYGFRVLLAVPNS